MKRAERSHKVELNKTHSNFQKSARNLLHYRKLRTYDMRSLQKKLGNLGITRFAHAEQHILFNLFNVKYLLELLCGKQRAVRGKSGLSIKSSHRILERNVDALMGSNTGHSRVRLMVTIPLEGASNQDLIDEMVSRGMSIARINCSHDSPKIWTKMIDRIRKAESKFDRKVKIAMDLGGPKIRTGQIRPGPRVMKISPKRDASGLLVKPRRAYLIPKSFAETKYRIPVDKKWFNQIVKNDKLSLIDTRGKKRYLEVVHFLDDQIRVLVKDTVYIQSGTEILNETNGLTTVVGDLPTCEQKIPLIAGDQLKLERNTTLGDLATYDEKRDIVSPARISCTLPEIIDQLKLNDTVKFDDGKISAIITGIDKDHVDLQILRTKGKGTFLKADKGINFPGKQLSLSGLTKKDREDLKFIAKNADLVNYSFINSPQDVQELFDVLEELGASDRIGVILKIETQAAFNNLVGIILKAMQTYPIGVMIARGDLAIEAGWHKMGRIQEEILSICAAAHIPVIWATQVLESLAKEGVPSRSEISDVLKAVKAECVMLNKGPYINQAMDLLNEILLDAETYREKNDRMLPELLEV